MLIPFLGKSRAAAIALLVISMFSYGLESGGSLPTVADMTNEYPATVFGFGNTFASMTGIVAPLVAGALIEAGHKEADVHAAETRSWDLIFFSSAAICFAGGIFFVLTASAERQLWGHKRRDDKELSPSPSATSETALEMSAEKHRF